ncbi:MAG: OmpA family protein [Rhodospirillales bacterium]|nr:OmpA family protein [Rhodospirillales bacterium]
MRHTLFDTKSRKRGDSKFSLSIGGVLAASVLLGGCSYVPDALNPAEWYKSTVDFFSSEEDAAAQQGQPSTTAQKPVPGSDKGFPKLSSTPEAPVTSTAQQRQEIKEGLVSDQRRRYASAPIARQGEASAAAPVTASTAPPPPAMPVVPVTPVPVSPPSAAAAPSSMAAAPAPSGAGVSSTYRQRLSERLKPSQAAALPPSSGFVSGSGGPLTTVVISSTGVVTEGGLSSPGTLSAAPSGNVQFPSLAAKASTAASQLPPTGQVRVATILFGNGSDRLTANDVGILREVVKLHQQRGGTIRIVGHASSRTRNMDPIRHKMVNFKVSADRADTIAKALMRLGAKPETVTVRARSDTDPLYFEVMPSGEAGNRRAEIYLDS